MSSAKRGRENSIDALPEPPAKRQCTDEAKALAIMDDAERADRAKAAKDGRSRAAKDGPPKGWWPQYDQLVMLLDNHPEVTTPAQLLSLSGASHKWYKDQRTARKFAKLPDFKLARIKMLRIWGKDDKPDFHRAERTGKKTGIPTSWLERFKEVEAWFALYPDKANVPRTEMGQGLGHWWHRQITDWDRLLEEQRQMLAKYRPAPIDHDRSLDPVLKTANAMTRIKQLLVTATGESLENPSSILLASVDDEAMRLPSLDSFSEAWRDLLVQYPERATVRHSKCYLDLETKPASVNLDFHSCVPRERALQAAGFPVRWQWNIDEACTEAQAIALAESTRRILARHFGWVSHQPMFGPDNWSQIPRFVAQYVAGAIDGDGCIRAADGRQTKAGRVSVFVNFAQASKDPKGPVICRLLYHMFGGVVARRMIETPRPSWRWDLHATKRVRCLLHLLHDHCALKYNQAKLALDLLQNISLCAEEQIVAGVRELHEAKQLQRYQSVPIDTNRVAPAAYQGGLFDAEGTVILKRGTVYIYVTQKSSPDLLKACERQHPGGRLRCLVPQQSATSAAEPETECDPGAADDQDADIVDPRVDTEVATAAAAKSRWWSLAALDEQFEPVGDMLCWIRSGRHNLPLVRQLLDYSVIKRTQLLPTVTWMEYQATRMGKFNAYGLALRKDMEERVLAARAEH